MRQKIIHILMVITGCKEENNLHPFGPDIVGGTPGTVSRVSVENIAGGAIIRSYYSLSVTC